MGSGVGVCLSAIVCSVIKLIWVSEHHCGFLFSMIATCMNPCQNGGTCAAPDTCTCDMGWTGMQCETGGWIHRWPVTKAASSLAAHQWVFHYPLSTGRRVLIVRSVALIYLSLLSVCWGVNILLLSCVPALGCGDPGSPTNGQRSLSSTTYNSVVTYTCDVGYTLQGSNSRTCQSSGLWSGSVPQCTRMLSSIPIVFSPGVHHDRILLIHTPVQLSVPVPVKMEGPAQLLTLAIVMWDGQECSVKQVGEVFISFMSIRQICRRSAAFETTSPAWFALYLSQLLAVVILVLPQMVNAVSPVQPTTL